MKTFCFGFVAGALVVGVIVGFMSGFEVVHNREKEILKYVELQQEIEVLRNDYNAYSIDDFFQYQGVRGAADESFADFERKRDEVLQRFRDGIINR